MLDSTHLFVAYSSRKALDAHEWPALTKTYVSLMPDIKTVLHAQYIEYDYKRRDKGAIA